MQLDEFFLTKLQIQWHKPAKKESKADLKCTFGYDVAEHATDANRQRLTFRLIADSDSSPLVGYAIGCEIVGFFRFEDATLDAQKKATFLRMNGTNILLGILRGQLANITGSFPHRKFVLPAVNIRELVETVETAKRPQPRKKTANRETKKPAPPSKKKK